MKNPIRAQLLWIAELLKFNLKAVLEYRSAFLIQVVGMMVNDAGFIIVWFLFFQIFGSVNGWYFKEMIGLYGFTTVVFGLVLFLGNGVRKISRNVTFGQLDRFLVLPKNPLLNIIFSESNISALGDLFFGFLCLLFYIFVGELGTIQILMIPILIVAASIIFVSFIIIVQSLVFWIPNSEELSNTLFEFMLGPSLYPNSSYTGFTKMFFTFFIPAILIGGLPVNILLSMKILDILLLFILAVIWLFLAIGVFNLGLKRYESGNLVGIR